MPAHAPPGGMRVALVTCALFPALTDDDRLVAGALAERGAEVLVWDWRRPSPGAADLVVLRSPWNHPEHAAEFDRWLGVRAADGGLRQQRRRGPLEPAQGLPARALPCRRPVRPDGGGATWRRRRPRRAQARTRLGRRGGQAGRRRVLARHGERGARGRAGRRAPPARAVAARGRRRAAVRGRRARARRALARVPGRAVQPRRAQGRGAGRLAGAGGLRRHRRARRAPAGVLAAAEAAVAAAPAGVYARVDLHRGSASAS